MIKSTLNSSMNEFYKITLKIVIQKEKVDKNVKFIVHSKDLV